MQKVKFEYLIEYRGIKVILTDHVRKQHSMRHGFPIEGMKTFFMQAIDAIRADLNLFDYNQEVFIYNRAFTRGMICAFRRDCRSDSGKIAMVAVTVYPYGKNRPAHADTVTVNV